MQTVTVFLLITTLVALVTVGMARFYTKVSTAAEDSHWVTRTGIVATVIAALVMTFTITTILALTFDHYDIAHIPLNIVKMLLLVQVIMAAMLFVLPVTRRAAVHSTEGKVLAALFSAMGYLITLAFKLVRGVMRLSAKGSNGSRENWNTRGAWSQHGYEGYAERSERIRGKPFGDHL